MTIKKSVPMASREDREAVENALSLALKFNEDGLIPVFVTDAASGKALMQAWMNEEAIALTLSTSQAHYFSRSRQSLWHKGATSGEIQDVVSFHVDCDQDSLWLQVNQRGGGCCHVGYESCFYREIPLGAPENGEPITLVQKGKKHR